MSYIVDKLLPGEKIMFCTEINWTAYTNLLLPIVISIFLIYLDIYSLWITIPLLFGLALSIYIKIKTSEFVVTNKRVVMKMGLLNTESVEIMLSKIETILVEQSIFDRLVKRGTIIIRGTGGTANVYNNIDNPMDFRKRVIEQIDIINNH